ncbi:hypothetical protein D3C85_1080730 [compost metagenome]
MPALEQADRLRPSQAFSERRRLTPSGLHQKVRNQRFAPFDLDSMPRRISLNSQHSTFDHLNASQAQVFAQAAVEDWTVQQKFNVLRVLLTVPRHLPLGRQRRLRQRLMQASAAQSLQHPHRDTFQRGKPAPLADQRHGITEPP